MPDSENLSGEPSPSLADVWRAARDGVISQHKASRLVARAYPRTHDTRRRGGWITRLTAAGIAP